MWRKGLYGLLLMGAAALAHADTLLVNSVPMDSETASSRPQNGMTMAKVEAKWGEPQQRHAAVGDPPITRWDYADFSVYFEYKLVIHSVVHHGKPVPATAKQQH